MSNELTDLSKSPMDNFKASLTEKIAAEAGSIMPADVLQQLISESVTGMIKDGMQGYSHGQSKGWIRQEIETTISAQVSSHVATILADETFLRDAVKEIFTDALPRVLMQTVASQFEYSVQNNIRNIMQNGGF